ncbi:hypothetical protein LOK49_LG06G02631 [Camellia lanceoleosa]|uniref:Uncharacterized protein n=1 Tax=Camellia lanceoleosa TaxID=1840588 RepID=A0ACC0HA79_9ERIC|nr:hypothetical protein LOK49_LG06G02631 [Camellia lanceoleosa]
MESPEEKMNIYLKVIKAVALKVKTSETIKNLKAMLREKEGISENIQELFFTGERLNNDQKLVDYGIQTHSTLHLILQNSCPINFFIYIPSNQKIFELEVKTRDTVQNIKSLIQDKEGIQSDRYKLFYGGKPLEDNSTLAFLNIQPESILHLVFNPTDALSISVKMSNGEILKPEVKLLHTISDVKGIIGSMIGVLVSDNDVVYDGKRLEDGKSLAFYNIIENSIIEILPKLPSLFQIFVKHWNGKTLVLTVLRQHKDKVRDVKDTIFNRLGGPASLVFAGKSLEDDQDLGSYNIQRLSTVHIAVPPPL